MSIETSLELAKGEDATLSVGVGVDLSADSIALSISRTWTGDSLLTKTTASGITLPASTYTHPDGTSYAANYWFRVAFSAANTDGLDPGTYVWQAWRTTSSSHARLCKGRFTVEAAKVPT